LATKPPAKGVQVIQIENYASHHWPTIHRRATGSTQAARNTDSLPGMFGHSPPATVWSTDIKTCDHFQELSSE